MALFWRRRIVVNLCENMALKITSNNLRKLYFLWKTKRTHFVMCSYVWLEQVNVCATYGIVSDKSIRFIGYNLEIKFSNNLSKIKGTGCYNINVTFRSSKKDGLLKYVKFEFRHVCNFCCIWKKYCKVFGKNTGGVLT